MNKYVLIVGNASIPKEESNLIFINRDKEIPGISPVKNIKTKSTFPDQIFGELLELDEIISEGDFTISVIISKETDKLTEMGVISYIKYLYKTRKDVSLGKIIIDGADVAALIYLEEIVTIMSKAGVKDIKKSLANLLK